MKRFIALFPLILFALFLLPASLFSHPQIAIDPDRIEDDMAQDVNEVNILISNTGNATLRWRAGIEIFIEPDNSPVWLTIEPSEGEIEAGRDMNMTATLDSRRCIGGDYEAEIQFDSNDPVQASPSPDAFCQVHVHIEGFPNISVEWPEECGFPNVMDFNRRYPDVFVSGVYTFPFTVRSVGTDDLALFYFYLETNDFALDLNEEVVIPIGDSLELSLSFTPEEPGVFESTLTLVTNVDQETIEIPLNAEAFLPPVIAVDPNEIMEELGWGETVEYQISISNDGEYILRWFAELEELNPDGDSTIITFAPAAGEIEPGAAMDVTIRIDLIQSHFMDEFNLWIHSNDPVNPAMCVLIRVLSNSVDDSGNLPILTDLVSAYPNPFNSRTLINYSLDRPGPMTLAIYGIDGSLIEMLNDGVGYAGYHSVVWNAAGIPAGSYLTRLYVNGIPVGTQKLILIK